MVDSTSPSPFARLDTSLMRSTKSVPPSETQEIQQPVSQETPLQKSQRTGTPVPPVRDVPPVLPVRPVPPEREVRPVPFKKRVMKPRHPFDIYLDQYESLKQLADKDRRQGGAGSMSAMVREAIDTFLAKRNRKGK